MKHFIRHPVYQPTMILHCTVSFSMFFSSFSFSLIELSPSATLPLILRTFQVTEHRHLKYYVSMAGPDLLCVCTSKESQEILKRIEREATYTYQTLTLSEEEAANVLYINGTLIHRTMNEIPLSCQILAEKIDIPRQMLNMTELSKLGTGLSSCCLLLRRSKYLR